MRSGAAVHQDLAWSYDFPTRQLLPIAGLIAFYNEKVDITVDGTAARAPGHPLLLSGGRHDRGNPSANIADGFP